MQEPMDMKSKIESEDQDSGTPLDEIIARVESYVENPELATPETLIALRDELVDLKSVVDGDEPSEEEPMEHEQSPSLTIAIGKMRGDK